MKKVLIFIVGFLFAQISIAQGNDVKINLLNHNKKIDSLIKKYKKILNTENPHYAIFYEDSTIIYGIETSLIKLDTSRIDALRIMPKKEVQIFFGKDFTDTTLIEIRYLTSKYRCSPIQSKTTIIQTTDNKLVSKKRKKLRKRKPVPTHYEIKVNFIGYEDVNDVEMSNEPYLYANLRKRISIKFPFREDSKGEPITGKVVLHFILALDGAITDITLDPSSPVKHLALVEEAIRLMKKIGGRWDWNPNKQENKGVHSYHSIALDFILGYGNI